MAATAPITTTMENRAPSFPSMEDVAWAGKLRTLFEQARAARRPLVDKWNRNYKMLWNRYWDDSRAQWMPSPQLSEIAPICMSLVGWMTDQRVQYSAAAMVESNSQDFTFWDEVASDLERLMNVSLDINDERAQYNIALWDAMVYGLGWVKTTWDQSLAGGLGDAVTRRIDPYTLYPDPRARATEQADYFIELRQMSVLEIQRKYPDKAHLFSGGEMETTEDAMTKLDLEGSQTVRDVLVLRPQGGVAAMGYGKSGDRAPDLALRDGTVTVMEGWIREIHKTEIDTIDPTGIPGRKTVQVERWRVVVVAGAHVLMNELAEDIYFHGRHPYDRLVIQDTGEMHGPSMVEMLSDAQVAINRILASLQLNIELTGNPILLEDNQAGTSRTGITNKPGQRVKKNSAGEVAWLNPPQVHQSMTELLRYYLQRMEAISGLTAIARGNSPAGRNAQGVIDSVQEASFVRIRMALRELERTMAGAGRKKAALISDFYTQPRVVSQLGMEAERTHLTLRSRHFQRTTQFGAVPMEYMIRVEAGSGGHTSRQVEEDKLITLFTLGVIDEAAVLEGIRFPNWATVTKRVMEAKAMGLMQPPGARKRARA